MAKQGQVTKIYQLKTLGFGELSKELDAVTKKFDAIKKAKLSAQGKMALTQDTAQVTKYSEEIHKLILEEQQLRVEMQKLSNEQKALNLQRQADINLQRKKRAGNIGEAGSIAEIRKNIKELNAALIQKNQKGDGLVNFGGTLLSIDQATAKLKQLMAAEQDFRRQFAKDGLLVAEYTSGIVQSFKQMGLGDLVGGQITKAQEKLTALNHDFDKLQKELAETKAAGKATESIELQMIENRKEVIGLTKELTRVRADLRGMGDVGNQITSSISSGFKSLKGQVASFALQYISITALISKAQQGIADAKLSSDQTTDLEIQLGGTADEADRLNTSLKALNTRTTLTGLQQIADVALKAGASKENIAEITKAVDIMKVAFGKDFGSVQEGTETMAKLINIFFDDGEITGDRILKIGNAIRALANETVASVPFITDFSGRMAGVKQIANVTLPDILGLGAGFEEFKQSAEVSSTVLVKVIPKLAEDTAKFAAIAGVTKEVFSELLNNNPVEALIRVSESLVKSGKGIEEVSEALADSELGSGRITTIIATLGGKSDIFRERIARAGETMKETTAITAAFEKKNNNLAASIDKTGKKISDAFASKNFQAFLGVVFTLVTLLISNLPVIITLVGLLTINYIAQNAALLGLRAQVLFYNLAIGANLVLLNALRLVNIAYNAVLFIFNGALKAVTATMRLFGIATASASGPLGVILAIVGLIGTAFLGLSKAMGAGVTALDEYNRKLKAVNDVQVASIKIYSEQIARIDSWMAVIKSAAASADTKRKALEELIKINNAFSAAVKGNIIDLNELEKAYGKVTTAIKTQAFAQASASLTAEKHQKLVSLIALRQQLETQVALGKGSKKEGVQLSSTERDLLGPSGVFGGDLSIAGVQHVTFDFKKTIADLKKREEAALQELQDFQKVQKDAEEKLDQFLKSGIISSSGFEVDIKNIKDRMETLDKEISSFQGKKTDLDAKVKERDKLQKDLDKLLNKNQTSPSGRASRLSAAEKDGFKDIEAFRDKLLATNEKARLEDTIDEEKYLNNIYQINLSAIQKKLNLISGSDAEERKQIALLNLEKIKIQKETEAKIFEIKEKQLKDAFDLQVREIKRQNDLLQDDPNLPAVDKAQAQLDADGKIFLLQEKLNRDIDNLEKEQNIKSSENAKKGAEAILDIKDDLNKDLKELSLASLDDLDTASEKELRDIQINFSKQRQAILSNDKLTAQQKQRALEKLAKAQKVTILSAELELLTKQVALKKQLLALGLLSNEEYQKAVLEQTKKAEDLVQAIAEGKINKKFSFRKFFANLLGIDEEGEMGELLGQVLSDAYAFAQEAMHSFYDAERDRINQNLDLQLERLDLEKEQVIARAQSQAEIASLEKQYEAKKRKAEQEAGERLKKTRRAEAKIALAVELAHLAVAAASAGSASGPLAPIVIPILYGIMAGLAFGRYAINVASINREKFSKGGAPVKKGGQAKGKSHSHGGIPFNYEAENKELFIVNKKSAEDKKVRTFTGTNKQIASLINQLGGGIAFARGAKQTHFESGGYLGDSLQPPVYVPSSNTFIAGNNKDILEAIKEQSQMLQEQIVETRASVYRIKTYVLEKEITSSQKQQAKKSAIGTL